MRDYNKIIFDKINAWQGRIPLLDAFGRAGAEWVIIASLGWFASSSFVVYYPDWRRAMVAPAVFLAAWIVAWLINIAIGYFIKEPRPSVTQPDAKQLFKPLMNWKSFPSDHAMSAFLLFFFALIFALPGAWALFVLALWVVFGRMFSGVHYPVDIIGGLAVASVVAVWAKYILLFF